MAGRWFYAGIASLLSVISVLEHTPVPLLFSGAMVIYLWLSQKIEKLGVIHIALLAAIFLLISLDAENTNRTHFTGRETEFSVRFEEGLQFDGNKLMATASTQPENEIVSASYKMKTEKEADMLYELLRPGTVCRVEGALEEPNPATNPNAFDYRSYLKREGVHWMLELSGIEADRCYASSASLVESIQWWREDEVKAISGILGEESAGIAAALLFGDRMLIDESTSESYEKTGTVHLLAISGLHVTLVAGMVFYLLLRTGVAREHAQTILIVLLPAYAAATGLAPPVNRAVIMLMILLAFRRCHLRISAMDALSLAFLLMMFLSPYSIYDAGFQLTFTVSLSLLLSSASILNNRWPVLVKTAAISFVAQLASLPILLFYFYEFSPLSVLSNIIFVPFYSFVILPVVLVFYGVFTISPMLAGFLAPAVEILIGLANGFSRWLASLPFSSLVVGKPGAVLLVVWFSAIICFFLQWEKGFKGKKTFLAVLPALPLVLQMMHPLISPNGEIVFLDVGQGDSILIRLPYAKGTYLIDTGGKMNFAQEEWKQRDSTFEVGKDIVLPFLKSKGIRKLDKLILTHGDADHIGGAKALISELEIEKVMVPPSQDRGFLELETLESAFRSGSKLEVAEEGTGWKAGGASFGILGPARALEDQNEGSLILWAFVGGKSWLFTGDLGINGEKELLARFPVLKADVLKVGHHGSKHSTSESFIESISPRLAVISAGRGNLYGHPHKEVLDRLKEQKIAVLRTDEHGAIVFSFRGKTGTFLPFIP